MLSSNARSEKGYIENHLVNYIILYADFFFFFYKTIDGNLFEEPA